MELDLENFKAYNNTYEIGERKSLIAETLLALRQSANLSQNQVAKYIGIKSGTYSTYEQGTREAPAEIIVRLSLLYDKPADFILQTYRFDKETLLATKQLENMENDIAELKELAYDKEHTLNPEFKDMLTQMADVFSSINEKLFDITNNNDDEK